MRKIILFAAIGFGLLSSAGAADRPEASRYINAYSGGEGVTVWILRVGSLAKREALVQILGIDHGWDRRIQKMTMEPSKSNGIKYVYVANGVRHEVLDADDTGVEMRVPGLVARPMLKYDKVLSAQGNPEHFLTDYLEQK